MVKKKQNIMEQEFDLKPVAKTMVKGGKAILSFVFPTGKNKMVQQKQKLDDLELQIKAAKLKKEIEEKKRELEAME